MIRRYQDSEFNSVSEFQSLQRTSFPSMWWASHDGMPGKGRMQTPKQRQEQQKKKKEKKRKTRQEKNKKSEKKEKKRQREKTLLFLGHSRFKYH